MRFCVATAVVVVAADVVVADAVVVAVTMPGRYYFTRSADLHKNFFVIMMQHNFLNRKQPINLTTK